MKKRLPVLKSDKAAEELVAKADLTQYDLSVMRPIRFEFQPKSKRVNMRVPQQLLETVQTSAAKAGVPYQRFIAKALEEAVQRCEAPAGMTRRLLVGALLHFTYGSSRSCGLSRCRNIPRSPPRG
jgi:predicted DNA binding CopG/RHH family protein